MSTLMPARGALLFGLLLTGCYLRHGPVRDGDAAIARDASVDAGHDAGASRCCARWAFDRRLTIDAFGERTVTPRLVSLGGLPAVVVTGPSDPEGPSGAHLVPLAPDLARSGAPVPVTRGSFTWGQPASSGDRVAVCWGTGPGIVVRVYDAAGVPLASIATLSPMAASPCFGSAFFGDRFAFAFREHTAAGGLSVVVRLVDVASGEPVERLEIPIADESQDASLVATREGFAVAVPGDPTRLFTLDARARIGVERTEAPSRAVRVVPSGDRQLAVVRILDRPLDDGRVEGIWTYGLHALGSLEPSAPPADILVLERGPAPVFAADEGPCGELLLAARGSADLGVVRDPVRARIESYGSPPPGELVGDTSVLSMAESTYVAFASIEPEGLDSVVRVDRWICAER